MRLFDVFSQDEDTLKENQTADMRAFFAGTDRDSTVQNPSKTTSTEIKTLLAKLLQFGERSLTPSELIKVREYKRSTSLHRRQFKFEEGVAEAAALVTHRIGLTVTDPNHPMVSKRGETYQKSVRVTGPDREAAINQAIAHYRRKGYKVHDHHYLGTVDKPMAEATGDKPFDQMMTTIKRGTNKQKTADRKEQQKQTQQQARNAFGNMFGGGNPADKLKIREQGVAEDSLNEDPVIQFASKAHNEWRKNFDPTGTKERIKKNSDGTEGNINVPFEELHPDWKKENLAAGQAAMMAVKRFPNNIEQAAEYIHNEWMKRNPKADYNAAQHVAYDQLPEDEKEKDRVHVRTMMALSGKQGVAEGPQELPQWKKDWYAQQKPNSWPKHPQPYHNPNWIPSPEELKKLRGEKGVAEGSLNESAVFLNPTTVVVGQAHGQPLELSPDTLKKIQDIAAKHGAWYEGNGTDRSYTKGQIDRYVGSWDDEVAKTASANDPKWLYVLFANVDENNRVKRVGVDPKDTIFNRLMDSAQDNSFQGIGYTAQALQKFLQMASEGQYDFVKMSQQPATQENLTRFLKTGEALMWPNNWEQYPNKAGKIAKAATVDVRDQYLATRKAGVYVTGSGHLKAVQNITGKQGVAEGNKQLDELFEPTLNYYTLSNGKKVQVSYRPNTNQSPVPFTDVTVSYVDPALKPMGPSFDSTGVAQPWTSAPDGVKQAIQKFATQSSQGVAEASDRMQRYGQQILKRKAEQNAAAQAAGPQPKKEEPPASSDYDSMSTRDFMKQLRDQRRPKKKGVAEGSQLNELAGYASDNKYKHLGSHKRYDVYVSKQKFNNLFFIAIAENPRTLEAKFKTKGNNPEEAVNNLKLEIDKEIDVATKVSGHAILDFNVDFVKDILELSTDVFYAKIVAGPKLVIAGRDMMEYPEIMRDDGFKSSAIRTYKGGEGTTKLPGVPLSAKSAAASSLIANGRYVLGDETSDKDGNRVFDLKFDSVVHASNEKIRLRAPALTVGTNRSQGVTEAPTSVAVRLGRAIERTQGKTAASQARSIIPSSIPKKEEPKKDEKKVDEGIQAGDGFIIECGDSAIETVVLGHYNDGILIEFDHTATFMLTDAGITLTEAEYQGRTVPLGKRMAGDVKKSKVYVKKPNGNVVKVNFGDKNMTIKKHLPKHRKSYRARHHCENPGPKWKANYWSCRAW